MVKKFSWALLTIFLLVVLILEGCGKKQIGSTETASISKETIPMIHSKQLYSDYLHWTPETSDSSYQIAIDPVKNRTTGKFEVLIRRYNDTKPTEDATVLTLFPDIKTQKYDKNLWKIVPYSGSISEDFVRIDSLGFVNKIPNANMLPLDELSKQLPLYKDSHSYSFYPIPWDNPKYLAEAVDECDDGHLSVFVRDKETQKLYKFTACTSPSKPGWPSLPDWNFVIQGIAFDKEGYLWLKYLAYNSSNELVKDELVAFCYDSREDQFKKLGATETSMEFEPGEAWREPYLTIKRHTLLSSGGIMIPAPDKNGVVLVRVSFVAPNPQVQEWKYKLRAVEYTWQR